MRPSWLLVSLLAACAHRPRADDTAAGVAAAAPIEAAWRARDAHGLDTVWEAVDAVPERLREAPSVLAAVARLQVAEGLLADDPVEARRAFARARATGMACLSQDPSFEVALQQRRPARGLSALADVRVPCAAWTGYAAARWALGLDASAAALDAELVDALLARALEGGDPESQRIARWGRVLAGLRRPADAGGDPVAAQAELVRLYETEPGDDDWVRYEDVVRHVPRARVTPPERAPTTPEERAAARRVLGAAPTFDEAPTPEPWPDDEPASPGTP